MRLYFLKDIEALFAPEGIFRGGCVYDVSLNNTHTMLDNKFAIPEEDKPEKKIVIKKPKKRGRPKKK